MSSSDDFSSLGRAAVWLTEVRLSRFDTLIALYDGAGVGGALLFGEPWPLATEARDRYPERVVPFVAEGYANALHPDSSYVNPAGLEQLLAGRFVRGLGEIICRHCPSHSARPVATPPPPPTTSWPTTAR